MQTRQGIAQNALLKVVFQALHIVELSKMLWRYLYLIMKLNLHKKLKRNEIVLESGKPKGLWD